MSKIANISSVNSMYKRYTLKLLYMLYDLSVCKYNKLDLGSKFESVQVESFFR